MSILTCNYPATILILKATATTATAATVPLALHSHYSDCLTHCSVPQCLQHCSAQCLQHCLLLSACSTASCTDCCLLCSSLLCSTALNTSLIALLHCSLLTAHCSLPAHCSAHCVPGTSSHISVPETWYVLTVCSLLFRILPRLLVSLRSLKLNLGTTICFTHDQKFTSNLWSSVDSAGWDPFLNSTVLFTRAAAAAGRQAAAAAAAAADDDLT